MTDQMSVVRRFLMWWFAWPANPYVSVNVAQDFSACRDYLAALRAAGQPVSVNALLAGAVARSLRDFPQANARILGGRIRHQPHVGLAMPVDRVGSGAGAPELGLAVLEQVDTLTLRQIADRSRRTVDAERRGRSANRFVRSLTALARSLPGAAMTGGLDALHTAMRRPAVAEQVYRLFPITSALTNPGATFRLQPGQVFRGGAVALPQRLIHVGTLWAFSATQDEIMAIDGQPALRPMLPLMFLFDHRLIDGVIASRLLQRFGEILADPRAEFGPDAQRPPGPRA